MLKKIKEIFGNKPKAGILVGISGLVSIVLVGFVFANVFATASDYFYDSVNVSVDGVQGATAYMYLRTVGGGTFYTRQGDFSLSETNDGNGYITLQSLTASGPGQTTVEDFNAEGFRRLIYVDALFTGNEAGPSDPVMIAVYSVDKDTPAGDYTVSLSNVLIAGGTSGYGGEQLPDMNTTIHVTRSDEPTPKPYQVVTFRDGENNAITEITKYYGDADFTITKEVTTGDGAITEYHPDDGGSGAVAHTVPDSNTVGVGEPGDVEICAWVAETENYAATKACYTVHVLKRPLDIIGATIADKTYDGTTSANVTGVSFEDRDLSNEEYTATASFDEAGAGENKTVHVSVELAGSAVNHYVLNASNFSTTKTILPYQLIMENVEVIGSGTYAYNPDGVEPGVVVTAPGVFGGTYTLVSGTDYNVAYSDNMGVGTGHISVTATGNFTTSSPLVFDFTIEARGINSTYLIAPNTITEGHILDPGEISLVVDDHTLIRCANDGDLNCDYVLAINGNTGTLGDVVNVMTEGRNNYTGVAGKDITIVAKTPQTVTIGDVTDTTVNKVYGDANFTYTATTTGNGEISYVSSNGAVATVNSGSGLVTIVGVGDADIIATAAETDGYAEGTAKYTIHVDKKVITVSDVTVANRAYNSGVTATISSIALSENSLMLNTDFTASATFDDANAGERTTTTTVTLNSDTFQHYCFESSGDCVNTINVLGSATITQLVLSTNTAAAVLNTTTYNYDGETKEPTATVTVDLNGDSITETPLVAGTDYEISYDDNVNAGTSAAATITGKGNYTGSLSALNFTIDPAVVTDVVVTAPAQTYTGSALTPVLTVTGTANGASVTFTTDDYTVAAHEDFINAGNHTVTVNAKEGSNYAVPSTSGTFTIDKADSGEPAELAADLAAEVGQTLADLGEMPTGFAWADSSTVIASGMNSYAATYTKNGDTTNYNTANLSVPVIGFTEEYVVIEGAGQEYVVDEDGSATFEINADYALFETGGEVYVDNVLVDPENYDSWSSSTVIRFKKSYMDSLAVGGHTLAVVFNNGGVARTTFTVATPAPDPGAAYTGMFTGISGGAAATGFTVIAVVSLIGIVYTAKKRNN